jgi:hypothetical protein
MGECAHKLEVAPERCLLNLRAVGSVVDVRRMERMDDESMLMGDVYSPFFHALSLSWDL